MGTASREKRVPELPHPHYQKMRTGRKEMKSTGHLQAREFILRIVGIPEHCLPFFLSCQVLTPQEVRDRWLLS